MKQVYKYEEDFGRMGVLDGVFVADYADVEKLMGRTIYFGEVLGKHSDIDTEMTPDVITKVSDCERFANKLEQTFGTTVCGYNPFEYLDPDEDEQD